jgi:hypothetical protein
MAPKPGENMTIRVLDLCTGLVRGGGSNCPLAGLPSSTRGLVRARYAAEGGRAEGVAGDHLGFAHGACTDEVVRACGQNQGEVRGLRRQRAGA